MLYSGRGSHPLAGIGSFGSESCPSREYKGKEVCKGGALSRVRAKGGFSGGPVEGSFNRYERPFVVN